MKAKATVMGLFAVLFFSGCGSSDTQGPVIVENQGPLSFPVLPGWKANYQGDKGVQFYSVTREGGEMELLMFSRWPAPGGPEQIPSLVDTLAKGFALHVEGDAKLELENTDYKSEELQGDSFSGRFVLFTLEGGLVQSMFMVSDGDDIWNGQFSGSKERWDEALTILKGLSRNS